MPPTDSPPKYVPQFSATTEMILKRIQSGASATMSTPSGLSSFGITGTPPGYEDMRRNVLLGMKTTLNMEVSDTPPIQYKSRTAKGSVGGSAPRLSSTPKSADGGSGRRKPGPKPRGKAGSKRKRAKSESMSEEEESDEMSKLGGDSDSDDAGSVTEFPKVTQSGRQIVKPAPFVPAAREPSTKRRAPSKRSQEQALCKTCSRGHSPQNNMIVFCDGCNLGWHQMCHDPVVSEEMVKDETAPWFCLDCSRKRGMKTAGAESKPTSWQGRSSEEVFFTDCSKTQHILTKPRNARTSTPSHINSSYPFSCKLQSYTRIFRFFLRRLILHPPKRNERNPQIVVQTSIHSNHFRLLAPQVFSLDLNRTLTHQ